MGIQNNVKIHDLIVPAYPSGKVPLEIFMARKSGMGFLGG